MNDLHQGDTQPTLETVLEMLRGVQQNQRQTDTKLDEFQSRFDEFQSRTDSRFDQIQQSISQAIDRLIGEMNTRFAEIGRALLALGHKIDALNRSRLQTEADYQDLRQRMGDLESRLS